MTGKPKIISHNNYFLTGVFIVFMAITIALQSSNFDKTRNKDDGNNLEVKVKAAYIYNFTKFVYWNRKENNEKVKPIIIGVFGSEPISALLEDFSKKQTQGNPIIVKRIDTQINTVTEYDLVFIDRSKQLELSAILNRFKVANLLTVSDINDFAQKGGMIGFFNENNRIKIEINLAAVKQAGLKISAKLLEVSRIVEADD